MYLSSIFSKLLEQRVYSRFYFFLTKFSVLFKDHFGFQNNHSPNHGLINPVKLKNKHLDNNYLECGRCTDLKKSFDTINHDILLAKLEHCGVVGQAKNWLESFLKNQKQYLLIFGYSSDVKNILCRVPQ